MRHLLIFIYLTGVVSSAMGDTYESSIDVRFPNEVAGLSFVAREEFPQKELGVNVAYERSGPVRGSVFIYKAGLSSVPSGTEAPLVRKHFAQIIADVKKMESLGKLRAVTLLNPAEQTTTYQGCGPQFVWREYEMEFPNGATLTSYTYLTGLNGSFVKLRVSHRRGDAEGRQHAEHFVQRIRMVLGNCK